MAQLAREDLDAAGAQAEGEAGGSRALLGQASRFVALLAAWVAMCGSLFMSEVLQWPPCSLCWYQRILMYPLAGVLAIGIMRRDRGLPMYVLPFSLLGLGVSMYHHLLIKTDWFPPPPCVASVPCNVDYLNWMDVVTIPLLAFTAFLIITLTMGASALLGAPADAEVEREPLPEVLGVAGTVVAVAVGFVILSRVL
ncbi:MAG: hypothetical protein OHK0022_45330 [Roseiflexaceae bacterium]